MSSGDQSQEGAPEAPRPPLTEGRYVDFMPVGEGGMGIVYWAIDRDLNRQVAFKIVRPPSDASSGNVTPPLPYGIRAPSSEMDSTAYDQITARFLQEAWVTGGMEHPGIVPVYELGKTEAGVPYYTMRFVRGNRTLRTAIKEVASKPIDERLKLLDAFLRVCDTIRYAHNRGVIHRDLKPENIGLGEYGEVVVLDWGLAKLTDKEQTRLSHWQGEVQAYRVKGNLETMPTAVGTPGYMAPEAAQGLPELDERCDIYSLGVLLFEIMTGERPTKFDNFRDYQARLVAEPAPNAREVQPDVPPALADVCQHALARDPKERTQSAQALSAAVRAWQDERLQDREIAVLLAEAEAGLQDSDALQGDALIVQADRSVVACQRVLELRAGAPQAEALLIRAQAARERGIAQRERVARSKTIRRALAVGLAVAAIGAAVMASVLEDKRQDAESSRQAATQARARAVADRERAEDALSFMVGDLQESLQAAGRLDLLRRLGKEARGYFERVPDEDVTPRSLANGTRALLNLGDVHRNLGDLPEAMRTFQSAQRTAQRLVEDELGRPLQHEVRMRIAEVLVRQGYYRSALKGLVPAIAELEAPAWAALPMRRVRMAHAHALLGVARAGELNLEPARAAFSKVLSLARSLAREAPDSAKRHRELAQYLLDQRRTLLLTGDEPKLKVMIEESDSLVSVWRARVPKDVRWMRFEAEVVLSRGEHAMWIRDDRKAARPLYEQALAAYERLFDIEPLNARYLATIGLLSSRVGDTTSQDDQPAIGHWQRAYEIQEQLVAKDPTNASWLHRLVNLADPMVGITGETGGTAETIRTYREKAVRHAKQLVAVDAGNPLARHLYAYALFRVSNFQSIDEATASRLEVIATCEDLVTRFKRSQVELGTLACWAAIVISRQHPNVETSTRKDALDRALALADHCSKGTPKPINKTLWQARMEVRQIVASELIKSGDLAAAKVHLRASLDDMQGYDTSAGIPARIRREMSDELKSLDDK